MKPNLGIDTFLLLLTEILVLQPFRIVVSRWWFLVLLAALVGWLQRKEMSLTVKAGSLTVVASVLFNLVDVDWTSGQQGLGGLSPAATAIFLLNLVAFGLTPTEAYVEMRPGSAIALGAAASLFLPTLDFYPLTTSPPLLLQLGVAALPMVSVAFMPQSFLRGRFSWLVIVVEPFVAFFVAWLTVVPFVKAHTGAAPFLTHYYWKEFALPVALASLLVVATRCVSRLWRRGVRPRVRPERSPG